MREVSATLAERGGRYGAFADHAVISQGLQEVLFKAPNWSKLDPDMRQALCVIMDKTARILNGDPYYDDNWHDIQGYASLVEQRILKLKEAESQMEDATVTEERDPLILDEVSTWPGYSPVMDQEDKFLGRPHAYDIPDER